MGAYTVTGIDYQAGVITYSQEDAQEALTAFEAALLSDPETEDDMSDIAEQIDNENKKAFFTALAKVQGELVGAKKDSKNPHFKNNYADLESVWSAWALVGPKNGFSVIQKISDAGEHRMGVVVETVLAHSGGHTESTRTFVPAPKGDAQGYGSAITYGRRYSLAAMVGIVQVDDDGEAARQASGPDVSALKSFADGAFKDKDARELRSILDNPACKGSPKLTQYVSALLARLETKET